MDVAPPDERFEAGWRDVGPAINAILRSRGRVLVHCRGGLGRAGTVTARILIEQGEAPHDAVHEVRTSRPGAIETDAQLEYVDAQLEYVLGRRWPK